METPLPIPNREVKRYSADDTRKGKVGSRQLKVFEFGAGRSEKLSLVVPMILERGEGANTWSTCKTLSVLYSKSERYTAPVRGVGSCQLIVSNHLVKICFC